MRERDERSPSEHFYGVRFGAQREEAIALLTALARRFGQDVAVSTHGDGISAGGSVYLEGAEWTLAFSYDDYDEVCSHVGMWRKRPAGREASVAWIASRIEAYGLPDCIALLAPTAACAVTAILEWSTAAGCAGVTLRSCGGDWDVREDLEPYPRPRTGLVALREHRSRLDRLQDRLARRPARAGTARDLLERMEGWVREQGAVLARLEPLLPGVGVLDVAAVLPEAVRVLDAIDGGLPDSDGAFLVIRAPVEPQTSELRARLWSLSRATGLRAEQLTWRPGFAREPTTGEPLPPPPDEQIDWLEGPVAARLLREDLLRVADPGLGCEVVPASFVEVDGAIEEWLRVPPAAASPWSRKYAAVSTNLHPLRLVHPPSGESVYLNSGSSTADLRRYAHALLAARLGRRAR